MNCRSKILGGHLPLVYFKLPARGKFHGNSINGGKKTSVLFDTRQELGEGVVETTYSYGPIFEILQSYIIENLAICINMFCITLRFVNYIS